MASQHEKRSQHENDGVQAYESDHLDAYCRIWLECGWISDVDQAKQGLARFADAGHSSVAILNGEPESFGSWFDGTVRYDNTDLSLGHIAAITTSRVGRRQGFASQLTERCLAEAAEAGFAVASLGIFDEGFYDKFGFGTGAAVPIVQFDPASLRVNAPYVTPERLTLNDLPELQEAVANRLRSHGAVTVDSAIWLGGEWESTERAFALGYRNEEGRVTHFVMGAPDADFSHYEIFIFSYETTDQLLQLVRLVSELGDQAVSMMVVEPAHLRLMDLIERPRRQRRRSLAGKHEAGERSDSWWQMRILDLSACIAARSWPGDPVEFNLSLTDPLADSPNSTWAGIGGDYTVHIGAESTVEPGHGSGLPQLDASVGAFTRMWLSVLPATHLTMSDSLSGPADLLTELDRAFALPTPKPGLPL